MYVLDPDMAENQTKDLTKISQIMFISQVMRTTRLIFLLLCVSFFTGLCWYIFCDLIRIYQV